MFGFKRKRQESGKGDRGGKTPACTCGLALDPKLEVKWLTHSTSCAAYGSQQAKRGW